MKNFVGWLFIVICIGYLIFLIRRWRAANRPHLTEQQCEEYSWLVVDDLFASSSRPLKSVRILPSYWQCLGLNVTQWIFLCRWMDARGIAMTPGGMFGNWGWNEIVMNSPPPVLVLSKRYWGLAKERRDQQNSSIGSTGDGNGSTSVSGEQIVVFGQGLSGDDLGALVEALRQDAKTSSEPRASSLLEAASILQDAAEGRESATSPAVTGALKWVRQCVTDAVGNAGGQALLTATVAVARALGWV